MLNEHPAQTIQYLCGVWGDTGTGGFKRNPVQWCVGDTGDFTMNLVRISGDEHQVFSECPASEHYHWIVAAVEKKYSVNNSGFYYVYSDE